MSKVTGLSGAELESVTVTLTTGESYTRMADNVDKGKGVLAAFCNSEDTEEGVNTDAAVYAGLTNYQLASITTALLSELKKRAPELHMHVLSRAQGEALGINLDDLIAGHATGNDPLAQLMRMLDENGEDDDEEDDTFVRPDVDGIADIDEVL